MKDAGAKDLEFLMKKEEDEHIVKFAVRDSWKPWTTMKRAEKPKKEKRTGSTTKWQS